MSSEVSDELAHMHSFIRAVAADPTYIYKKNQVFTQGSTFLQLCRAMNSPLLLDNFACLSFFVVYYSFFQKLLSFFFSSKVKLISFGSNSESV